jgi:hypothetical protein
VYDPVSQESDSDFLVFGVLWVVLDLRTTEASKDNGGYAHHLDPYNEQQAAYDWFFLRTDYSLGLGPSPLLRDEQNRPIMFGYAAEIFGTTTPPDWGDVAVDLENPVKLLREIGPPGCKAWGGELGNQLMYAALPGTEDTSFPLWRDDGPCSDYTWPPAPLDEEGNPRYGWGEQTFESGGVVYDLDYPGATERETNIVARHRANFIQWAVWEYGGDARCSADLHWHEAMSTHWTGNDFELVNGVDGDNHLGQGFLPSVEWNGPLTPLW